jgi:cytidylate kinase
MQPGELIVEREIARWRMSRAAADRLTRPSVPAPLITISRQLGSGGRELAKTLGARLHWPVYDREIVDEMVRQSHANRQLVLDLDESVANRALLWIGAMVTQELFDYDDYRALLLRILSSLAEKGSAIILGRGANFAARLGPRLDVRIIAPLEARVERLVRRDGISSQQAMLVIRHSDQCRRDFTQRVHQGHWDDASNYDLVINTGKLTVFEAAELVEDALKDLTPVADSRSA